MDEEDLFEISCTKEEQDVLRVLQVADELFITVLIYDPNNQEQTISLNEKTAGELRDRLNRFLGESDGV